jgi:hypothetical protein
MFVRGFITLILLGAGLLAAQDQPALAAPGDGWRKTETPKPGDYAVQPGTKVPLSLINSVSTKHSAPGDSVYMQTVFPILVSGRIVIPPGSYVTGTVTEVKRPGRVKGRGELFVRFDTLTLPNGVTRDFRGRLGSVDGRANEELDRSEGKIKSEGNKGGDARTIGEAAAAGASVGVIAGAAAGHYGMGTAIGGAAGAAAGMIGVLLSRGPDAVLARGSTIEMVLDRPVNFTDNDLNFGSYQPPPPPSESPAPASKSGSSIPVPAGRFPF